MNLFQNSGNARSENTTSWGRQPNTSAMHSDPARYQPLARSELRPRIQKYRPQIENAMAHMMGSE